MSVCVCVCVCMLATFSLTLTPSSHCTYTYTYTYAHRYLRQECAHAHSSSSSLSGQLHSLQSSDSHLRSTLQETQRQCDEALKDNYDLTVRVYVYVYVLYLSVSLSLYLSVSLSHLRSHPPLANTRFFIHNRYWRRRCRQTIASCTKRCPLPTRERQLTSCAAEQ